MPNYPFNTIHLEDEEIKHFHRSYKALKKGYAIQKDDHYLFPFELYLLFSDYETFFIREAFLLFPPQKEATVTFTQVHYTHLTSKGGKISIIEYELGLLLFFPRISAM